MFFHKRKYFRNQLFEICCDAVSHFQGEILVSLLGQRIRAARIRMGMTQEELAEEMCTTKSMISYYENDHGDMKQSMIAEFAVILRTTVEYLVCGVIKESAPDESSAEMLRLFSSMDERTKEIMLIQMRALVSAKR